MEGKTIMFQLVLQVLQEGVGAITEHQMFTIPGVFKGRLGVALKDVV